jgi:hypothetical protein
MFPICFDLAEPIFCQPPTDQFSQFLKIIIHLKGPCVRNKKGSTI